MEIADLSQEGSEVVLGGEGVVVVVDMLFREEGTAFLALFCAIGRDAMTPPLEFRALLARVLGPLSSGALSLSGLSHLRAMEGDSTAGSLGPAMMIGIEEGDPMVGSLGPAAVIGADDVVEGAA